MSRITNQRAQTIGGAARATGLHIETIRYYERVGLVPEPERTAGGYRVYNPDHIKRLSFIRRARALGFSIDEIRSLGDLMHDAGPTCADVHTLASRHLSDIRGKITDLQRIEATLEAMVGQCNRDDKSECAVIDALSEDTILPGSGSQRLDPRPVSDA